jgi:hypothetical protein
MPAMLTGCGRDIMRVGKLLLAILLILATSSAPLSAAPSLTADPQTGRIYWEYRYDAGKTVMNVATPIVDHNRLFVSAFFDGSIMLNMRNAHERFRAVFVTKDLGQTWQPHETTRNTLIEPNCNGSLLRMDYEQAGEKKHVLLFANPHSQQVRTHHTVQVSFDDGRTWPKEHHLLLDEGRGAGYPSLTRIDDRHVEVSLRGGSERGVFLCSHDLMDQITSGEVNPGASLVVHGRRALALAAIPPEDGLSHFRYLDRSPVPPPVPMVLDVIAHLLRADEREHGLGSRRPVRRRRDLRGRFRTSGSERDGRPRG